MGKTFLHREQLADIYQKLLRGDPLTDTELEFGIREFKEVAERLIHFGPTFRLAWRELNEKMLMMKDYQWARKASRERAQASLRTTQ